MRRRLTRQNRSIEATDLLAHIDELEKSIEADDDAKIDGWADDLAKEEQGIAEESTGEKVKDEGDQNAKAEKNWPVSAAEKKIVARRLVRLANKILDA